MDSITKFVNQIQNLQFEDAFSAVVNYADLINTLHPEQQQLITNMLTNSIASLYPNYNVGPAIEGFVQRIANISPEVSLTDISVVSQRELQIGTFINDMFSWLNSLQDCKVDDIFYIENYPVTLSSNPEAILKSSGLDSSLVPGGIDIPLDGHNNNNIMYLPHLSGEIKENFLAKLVLSQHSRPEDLAQGQADKYGMTLSDYVQELKDEEVKTFPFTEIWYLVNQNSNVINAIFGRTFPYKTEKGEHYTVWGFANITNEGGIVHYYLFFLEDDIFVNIPLALKEIMEKHNLKAIIGCGPLSVYDPQSIVYEQMLRLAHLK